MAGTFPSTLTTGSVLGMPGKMRHETRPPTQLECRLRRADGVYRWWLIRGVPLRDESGEILKWFGTCTDIDDLKQAEAAAGIEPVQRTNHCQCPRRHHRL